MEKNKFSLNTFLIILLVIFVTFLLTFVFMQQELFKEKMEIYQLKTNFTLNSQKKINLAVNNYQENVFSQFNSSTCKVYNFTYNNKLISLITYPCYVHAISLAYKSAYTRGYNAGVYDSVNKLLNATSSCDPVPITLGKEKHYVIDYNCVKK